MALWDPNKDHPAHRFDCLEQYGIELAMAHRSGKSFRIAYTGEASPDAFEVWAELFWRVLDGRVETFGVIEEYSDCCRGAGALSQKRDFYHRRAWTQSRKYGGILLPTTQKPQLITKDSIENAGIFWASHMGLLAADRIAKEMDITPHELRACGVGEFYYTNNGSQAQKIKVFTPK